MVNGLQPRWVDSGDGVRAVAEACRTAGRFAMDTEADSLHSYFHKVCLIQVTADGANFLIDPLALRAEQLAPLWEVVGDPHLPLVMHGSDYDIRVLDRDYGTRVCGLLDTQVMAQLLGEPRTGLGALLERDFGLHLDKKMQRADWGRRPLSERCLDYAAADTAFLEELADRLLLRVEELGRWEWVKHECARLEAVRHVAAEPDPAAFERVKGARGLKGAARDRLFTLYEWREERARAADMPPFKILGPASMVAVAAKLPGSLHELELVVGLGPRFVRRWGRQVLELLRSPRSAPPPVRGAHREAVLEPPVRQRVKALMAARDGVAGGLGLDSGLVCPKALVTAIALESMHYPAADACRRAGLEAWRAELLDEVFLRVLQDIG